MCGVVIAEKFEYSSFFLREVFFLGSGVKEFFLGHFFFFNHTLFISHSERGFNLKSV